jgi:hypothetical protein
MADRFFGRWGWLLCGLVLVEQLKWAPSSWPLPTADARLPSLYEEIPDDGSAILDLPSDLGVGNQTNRYLFWQRLHKHPVPWGNKVSAIGIASRNQAVVQWASLSRDMQGYVEGLDPNAIIKKETLTKEEYGTVILHLDLLKNTKQQEQYKQINKILGTPEKRKGFWIWSIDKNRK